MPRNSSGTMTLPTPGVPFQSGQTISSAQVNATFSDIATEISDSASRSGKGGFTAQVRGVDGTVAAPAVSFVSEPASGLYRAAANDVRLAVGGVDMLTRTGIVFPAQPVITTSNADTSVQIAGNKAAGSIGAELEVFSKVSRTAGLLAQFWNLNFPRLNLDYQGLLRLDATAVAAAIQPASMVTAITPNAGLTAVGFAYWKDACGMVHLEGSVTNASGSSISNIATTSPLPVGFRANATMVAAASGGFFSVSVSATTGAITTSTPGLPAGGQMFFDGLSFRATA